MHLFDIDIPGKIRFKESETLSPGNDVTIINTRMYFKMYVAHVLVYMYGYILHDCMQVWLYST